MLDSPVHGPTELVAALGFFQLMPAKNHRTVRARCWTVRCTSHATASEHVDAGQRSTGAPDSPVPGIGQSGASQKQKLANQGILCRVPYAYYSLSGAH
jgi:hypothetical protein